MTGFLFDTNVISELRKPKPHGAVVAWFAALGSDQIHICSVSLGELQRGVERTRHSNPAKAQEIESWIDELAATHEILPMDGTAFREWARLMDGKSNALSEDAMIAAMARIHRLTVATRNETDFAALRTPYFNPFKS